MSVVAELDRTSKPKVVEALVAAPPRARILSSFATGQAVNVRRHFTALRDFNRDEFGTSIARPSEGHIQAVNELLAKLRRPLRRRCATSSSASRPLGLAGAADRDLARPAAS